MKHWWRILALGCVCSLTATTFIACGSGVDAYVPKDPEIPTVDETIDNDNTATTPDNSDNQTTTTPTAPATPDNPTDSNVAPHEHHYGEWVIIASANCTEPATEQRECQEDGCNNFETRYNGEPFGHTYTSQITTPATCTQTGEETFTCDFCSDTYTETIPCLPHDYENNTCRDCGAANSDAATQTVAPIEQQLANTYWYNSNLKKNWVFYFDGNGNYYTYRYTLVDGQLVIGDHDENRYDYYGRYSIENNNGVYTIHFTEYSQLSNGINTFDLTYTVDDADPNNIVYTLTGLLFQTTDSTLIFTENVL